MKTTIEISDPLLENAKAVAAREGITLRTPVEQGLRAALEERERTRPFKLRDAGVTGNGLQPGARGLPWDALGELVFARSWRQER